MPVTAHSECFSNISSSSDNRHRMDGSSFNNARLWQLARHVMFCTFFDPSTLFGYVYCYFLPSAWSHRGPPSLPRELPQRWLRNELFAKNGADCRPGTCGWTSRFAGICYSIVCTRRLPLGCLVSNYINRAARGQPEKSLWRESIPWTRPQRSPGEVGAKSMVDVALQTAGPGHQMLHTCIPGQGWECSCRDWYIVKTT